MTVATASPSQGAPVRIGAASGSVMVRDTIGLAATLCATVSVLLPLFARGMAATHDGFLHVQRLIAIEAAIRQGTPFTRWLPDLAYGYGQPLLLFYAPLSYLPGLLPRLLGASYVTSFEIASGLALIASALAMYVLARALFDPLAAVVSAIVYAVLPYQLVDLYVRGALAESWAFVWLPLCARCLIGAWVDGRPRWSVGLALAVAALVLTHNVTALLFLPALGLLALVLYLSGSSGPRRLPRRPLLALVLGITLSAWFWLPALAERDLVQIRETIEPALFSSFFVRSWPPFRLEPLFDYQFPVSTALGYPIFWPQLGLVQVTITVVGAVVAMRLAGVQRAVAVWASLLALVGYLMQLEPLAPLYDLVPLLAFVQFPWRLLAVIGLGSAILAGVLVQTISGRTAIRLAFGTVIVAASLAAALARLEPEMTPVDERLLSAETIARSELADYGLGTTHSGEYLPVSSGQRNATRLRKTVIEAGSDDSRQASPSPTGLQVERVDWRPDRIQVEVSTGAPERLILHQFAFPGWAAWLDGSPVETTTVEPLGLLAVDVPTGRHRVELAWSWTPLRTGAAAVSLVAVLLLAPLSTAGRWRPTPRFALIALATAGLAVELLAPAWLHGAPDDTTSGATPAAQVVGEPLSLADASLHTSRLASDRVVVSRLVWLVRQAPAVGYRANLEISAADGQIYLARWPYEPLSRIWSRGEIVPTTVAARLPPDFPAGPAQVRLVFERPENLEPATLGSITVPPAEAAQSAPRDAEGVTVGTDLRVSMLTGPDGVSTDLPRARTGTPLDLPLLWEQVGVLPNVDRELLVVAALGVPGGEIVSEPRRPGDWFSPLPFWQQGDRVEQNLRLAVPSRTPPGTYPLTVRIYARDLARSGASEPGASSARPRGRPVAELALGDVTVEP